MPWNQIAEFTLSQSWQYTAPVNGRLFRVRHINAPANGRALIAQSSIDGQVLQLFNQQRLTAKVQHDLFDFELPPGMESERAIALKLIAFEQSPWTVAIDVLEPADAQEQQDLLDWLQALVDTKEDSGTAIARLTEHVEDLDPHPQYVRDSEIAAMTGALIYEGETPPAGSQPHGKRWRQLNADGSQKYPWCWHWDSTLNRWLSDVQVERFSLNSSGGQDSFIYQDNAFDIYARSLKGHALFSSAQTSANFWSIRLIRRNFGGADIGSSLVYSFQQPGTNTLTGRRPFAIEWNTLLDTSTNGADQTSSARTALMLMNFARNNSSAGVMTGAVRFEYSFVYV